MSYLRAIMSVVAVIPIAFALFLLCGVGAGLFLSPVCLGVVIAMVLLALRRWIVAQQQAFLWVLATAVERHVPLIPAIQAFACEYAEPRRSRLLQLAEMIASGASLPQGLTAIRGLVPREAVPLARIGFETGQLARALRLAIASGEESNPIVQSLAAKILYLCTLPVVFLFPLVFVMIKIVPAYEKIFLDFETDLPPVTVALVTVTGGFYDFWYLFWPVWVGLPALVVYVLLRYSGWVSWDLPGVARLARRFDSAAILDALALVARAERPLVQGVAALAQSYPKAHIRRRLLWVWHDVDGGTDWCESLLARGLLHRADAAVLQAAVRVGNLPWALGELADSSRRRLTYRLYALVQVLFPLGIVAAALVIGFFAVALFVPIIALIERLT